MTPLRFQISAFSALLVLATPASVRADTAYRWEDAQGRIVYGGKPAAGARNVQKVEAQTFSRYSSEKLLRPYQARTSLKEAPLSLPKLKGPADKLNKSESDGGAAPASLKQGELKVEHNDKGEITVCRLTVSNTGQKTAKDISVAFEFDDGTWLPANGPTTLDQGAEATYEAPADQLPIEIHYNRKSDDGKLNEKPVPRVIIQAS